MRKIGKYGLFVLLGISTWIPILITNNYYWIMEEVLGTGALPPTWPPYLHKLYFAGFFLANYIIIDRIIRKIEKWDVIDLLWKLLVIGISGISLTFLFQIIEESMKEDALHATMKAVNVSVSLYAMTVFVLSAMFIYRKLILYQKNKRKVMLWRIFQGLLLTSLIMIVLNDQLPAVQILQKVLIPVFFLIALLLSANVNWSAYLNFNQKLKSLFLIFIIVLLFVAFSIKFPFDALPYVQADPFLPQFQQLQQGDGSIFQLIVNLLVEDYLILGFFFVFPLIYTLFSGLVLIFNLPTSSVFEQRSSELATIQRINQSIQSNLDIDDILDTLMDASLLTSNATGGWIERITEGKNGYDSRVAYHKNVSAEEISQLREAEDFTGLVIETQKFFHLRNLRKHKGLRLTKTRIRSLLALPIMQKDEPIGVIYLINELIGSFEEETIVSLVGLTEQAGFAIENADLVKQSISFERYREQLKIAREVQEQILPTDMPRNAAIEFFQVSQDAEEIGGDYYDVSRSGSTYKVALGDVSGKGTEAAFYMAETKGIFQALTSLDMSVRDFVLTFNKALSKCFKSGSFLTLTYLHIYMEERRIELLRAGHCPTLFYSASKDELSTHEGGSPGLGIMRDDGYANLVDEPESLDFGPGDLLILYTDGILEARDGEKEEFGLERMKEIILGLRRENPQRIAESLLERVENFTGGEIEDDYTILVIKFLEGQLPQLGRTKKA